MGCLFVYLAFTSDSIHLNPTSPRQENYDRDNDKEVPRGNYKHVCYFLLLKTDLFSLCVNQLKVLIGSSFKCVTLDLDEENGVHTRRPINRVRIQDTLKTDIH